jgi:glycerol-3-phosphate O-acyltransferase
LSAWVVAAEVAAAVVAYEIVRGVVVRRVRRAIGTSAARFVRKHRIQLESARFIDRVWIREAMAQDPRVERAIGRIAEQTDRTVRELRAQVDAYVEEIAPFFSLSAYYRLGPALAKRLVDFCFELVLTPGAFEAQLAKIPPDAVRVYVINHRANMDPLVLAYGLLRHVPMSYAVGEWALVWPLHTMFRAFGSYFVRRGEKDPLYHAVLERFVQLLAGQGAVTGFFPEGGLSRDGALRPARTGLLDYIVGLRHDHPGREIAFMPVGLNYDRVLEDRILLASRDGAPLRRPTLAERAVRIGWGLVWLPRLVVANLLRVATRSHQKFGYAALAFGEPLLLSDWPGGAELHRLPDEARRQALGELGEELLRRRIGRVIPATPVSIFATALLREGPDDDLSVRRRVVEVLNELRARRAVLALGRAFDEIRRKRDPEAAVIHEVFEEALIDAEEAEQLAALASALLVRRGVLRRSEADGQPGHLPAADDAEDVLKYYANSIAHHWDPT